MNNESDKIKEKILRKELKTFERIMKNNYEDFSLSTLLGEMTKDELLKVSKAYDLKGVTNLKKGDLSLKLTDTIIVNNFNSLKYIDINTFNFLNELRKESYTKIINCKHFNFSTVNFLRNRGLGFVGQVNEETFAIIPDEIKDSILDFLNDNKNEAYIKENTEIITLIAGLSYYYGVINKNVVKEFIDKIYGKTLEQKYFDKLLLVGEELGYDYIIENENICHIDVDEIDSILNLQENNNNDYFKFDKKTLILSGQKDFIETNKTREKIENALEQVFVIDKQILKAEMESFIISIKNEEDIIEAIEVFLDAYQIESEDERKILTDEFKYFARTIKKWSLKGYSEEELEKLNNRAVTKKVTGRNEPCICGSGKKYKKCCGK